MKNVTKILTAAVLCAALFASDQRITALGGNAALWPGDEANIAAFPAQVNNHAHVQLSGVGTGDGDDATGGVSLITNVDGTTWGFNYGANNDWVNMAWGNGTMGVVVGLESATEQNCGTEAAPVACDPSDMSVSYGNTFDWGEIGVKYMTTQDGDGDAMLGVNYRTDWGFWLFDNTVVSVDDLMDDDLELGADFFTHMDAGGADVVFGWGFGYNATAAMADDALTTEVNEAHVATMSQSATIGVEANMTDWATLRVGYNWSHELACDNFTGTGDACGGNTSGFAWGLGFNWGGLTADYTVDSGIFQDPIGTITGNNVDAALGSTGLTAQSVTLTYSF